MSVLTALLGFAHSLIPALLGAQIDVADLVPPAVPATTFRAASADVANWRFEAATHLKLPTSSALLLVFGAKSETVPRCVKLNNFWCVKGKGWTGQLGSDGSGHAAFETAPAGARAAAVLLRHYYVDLHRRSAIDITSHWAPDRCGAVVARAPATPRPSIQRAPEILDVARMSPQQRMATFDRIIAARRAAAATQYRQKLQLVRAVNSGAAIPMVAMAPAYQQPPAPAARPAVASAVATPAFCALEERRVASYAQQALRGVAQTPTEDLQLFTADGRSTWRAARFLSNMAGVEIGPKAVDDDVVGAALHELDAVMVPRAKRSGT